MHDVGDLTECSFCSESENRGERTRSTDGAFLAHSEPEIAGQGDRKEYRDCINKDKMLRCKAALVVAEHKKKCRQRKDKDQDTLVYSTIKAERFLKEDSENVLDNNENSQLDDYMMVYPGLVKVRNKKTLNHISLKKTDISLSKRGKITKFSNKSRRSMMQALSMIKNPYKMWQDITFADDVMSEKSISERAIFSTSCLKRLKESISDNKIEICGIWKREWKARKSGSLKGQYIPHFHVVYRVEGLEDKAYIELVIKIAVMWVDITGTEDDKALKVALHEKSYRFIHSRKQMQIYMSKYILKDDADFAVSENESIGRNWGRIGLDDKAEPEIIEVTPKEMIKLKRCFRKHARNVHGKYKQILSSENSQFFLFIKQETINRLIEHINKDQLCEGVPF